MSESHAREALGHLHLVLAKDQALWHEDRVQIMKTMAVLERIANAG